MTAQADPRRRGFCSWLSRSCALGVLVALGTWQLERKAWKEALIAELDAKLAAPPTDLPPRERWQRLDAATDEFRRVAFPAEFLPGEEALVYSSGSSLRPDAERPRLLGVRAGAAHRRQHRGGQSRLRAGRPAGSRDARAGQPSGVVDIVGVMRWPEQRGQFTPPDEPAKSLWFARDPAAMAAGEEMGHGRAVLRRSGGAAAAPGGLPKVGPLKASLPNNHLQYAVTWYGLALVILIAASVLLARAAARRCPDKRIDNIND